MRSRLSRSIAIWILALRRIGRGRWHAIIELDRQFRLLHRRIKIGERDQRQRVRRLQIERELQIDEAKVFAAAAADPGAHAVECFGRALLRRTDDQRRPVAPPDGFFRR